MNIRRLFRSYKYKLLLEGLLKSLLFALMAGGGAVFVTSLVYHILSEKTPVILTALIGGGVFLLVFSLVFSIAYYPTKKRVALRMDEMGLEERVGTMLAFQKDRGFMVELQREDAILHIKKSSPKQLKMRSFLREGILCAVFLCLALTMLLLPHDLFEISAEKEPSPTETQAEIIKDLIEEMREEVKNSLLDEELKEEINEVIDDLEEDLNKTDSELEQAGKIEDAKEQIKDLLEKELTKKSIGAELQKYQLTKDLGLAVSNGELEAVSRALDALKGRLLDDPILVEKLYTIIDRVLEDSGVQNTDALYLAFADFSQGLKGLDMKSPSFERDLSSVFVNAKVAILSALEKQAAIETEKDKMEEILDDAKEEILGNKEGEGEGEGKGEGEGEGKGEGQGEGNGKGDGNGQSDENKGGSGDGSGEKDVPGMTEGIYDPVSGSVSYGKVFATYYADYLAACKEGKIPQEMQEILDAYFSELMNTKE